LETVDGFVVVVVIVAAEVVVVPAFAPVVVFGSLAYGVFYV